MPRDDPDPDPAAHDDAGHATRDADLERDLRERLAELAGINAIGIALGSTLDLDALVERGLAEIVGNLGFERGLMAFADPASASLGGCRVAGGPPGLAMLVTDLRVPLDDPTSALAALARADGPLRFRDAAGDPDEGNRRIAAVLGSTGFVGTPLVTQGRSVGVLVVGDRRSGRDLTPPTGRSCSPSGRCSPARSSRPGCTRSSRRRTGRSRRGSRRAPPTSSTR